METPFVESIVAKKIRERGYRFTESVVACKQAIVQLGVQEMSSADFAQVALMMIADTEMKRLPLSFTNWTENRTLGESWRPDLFAQSCRELISTLNLQNILYSFDSPLLMIRTRVGLCMFYSVLNAWLQNEPVPVHLFLGDWKNAHGQMAMVSEIVRNPDVIKLSEGCLGTVPCDDSGDGSAKRFGAWLYLDVIKFLLDKVEVAEFAAVAKECFKFAMDNFPDVLVAGLFALNAPVTQFRQDLLLHALPALFGGPSPPYRLFNRFWNDKTDKQQVYRSILLRALLDYHEGGRECATRIPRILEIVNAMEALPICLNVPEHLFTFQVACLASKVNKIRLDKWIQDKVKEQGDAFAQVCVNFVKERCLSPSVGGAGELDVAWRSLMPADVTASALISFQNSAAFLSPAVNAAVQCVVNQWRSSMTPSVQQAQLSPAPSVANVGQPEQPGNAMVLNQQPNAVGPPYAAPVNNAANRPSEHSVYARIPTPRDALAHGNRYGPPPTIMPPGPSVVEPYQYAMAGNYVVQGNSQGDHYYNQGQAPASTSDWGSGFAVSLLNSLVNGGTVVRAPGVVANELSQEDTIMLSLLPPFSPTVQEEANSIMQRLFSASGSVEQVTDIIVALSGSKHKHEQDVAYCTMKNILEEYRYYNDYPERELCLTAALYGVFIHRKIFPSHLLGIALRLVVDALHRELGSKVHSFGVTALENFKHSLKFYPGFCQSILYGSPDLGEHNQQLLPYITAGARGEGVDGSSYLPRPFGNDLEDPPFSCHFMTPTGTVVTTFSTMKMDTLVYSGAAIKESVVLMPAEALQQQVGFLFNNLSQANMSEKVDEMRAVIKATSVVPWIAQYLVVKRISAEINFHHLYFKFLQDLQSEPLTNLVIDETFRNIKVILCTNRREPDFADKTLLKNLGHWLGMMTIRRNRPIRRSMLDLKSLVVEAFIRSETTLLYVVPFVTKVLESCKKSFIFHPLCPWSMGIMKLLVELHQQHVIRLTLEFEVEMLCRHLKVDISLFSGHYELFDLEMLMSMIKKPQMGPFQFNEMSLSRLYGIAPVLAQQMMIEQPINAHPALRRPGMPSTQGVVIFADDEHSVPGMVSRPPPQQQQQPQMTVGQSSAVVPRFFYSETPSDSTLLLQMVEINPNIVLFQIHPLLKRAVRPAVEQAIQEVLYATRDRTQRVPMHTVETLVRKDFAAEGSEEVVLNASHNLARVLGCAMAMHHCRDPLYFAMQGYLKQAFYTALRTNNPDQQRLVTEAVQVLSEENIDLCLSFTMKQSCELLIHDLDKELAYDCELRQMARNEGRTFMDIGRLQVQDDALPPGLHANPSMTVLSLQSVYTDARIPGFKSTMMAAADAVYRPYEELKAAAAATAVDESSGEMIFQMLLRKLDVRLLKYAPNYHAISGYQAVMAMRDSLVRAETEALNVGFNPAVSNLVDKLTTMIYFYYEPNLHGDLGSILADIFVIIIGEIRSIKGDYWLMKQVSRHVAGMQNDARINLYAIDLFARNRLLDDDALHFVKHILRMFLVEKRVPPTMLNQTDWVQAVATAHSVGLVDELSPMERDGTSLEAFRQLMCGYGLMDTTAATDMVEDMRHRSAGMAPIMQSVLQVPQVGGPQQSPYPQAPPPPGRMMGPPPPPPPPPLPPPGPAHSAMPPAEVLAQQQQQQQQPPPGIIGGYGKNVPSISALSFSYAQKGTGNELPAGYAQQVEAVLRDWMAAYHSAEYVKNSDQLFVASFGQVHVLVKTEFFVEKFCQLATEICVDFCCGAGQSPSQQRPASATPVEPMWIRSFRTLDAYASLLWHMIKHTADRVSMAKAKFVDRLLMGASNTFLQEQELRQGDLRTMPFLRLLVMLFYNMSHGGDRRPMEEEPERVEVICAFAGGLHHFRPEVLPAFIFCWMDLVGSRQFMGCVLNALPEQRGFAPYSVLLIDLFTFLAPYLRNLVFTKPVSVVYKGALRILLVLLHDFPELLCHYHYCLCDVIPANCVQLRNLIVSAYPRSLRLPDPFLPMEQLEQLAEMNVNPHIAYDVTQNLPVSLKNDLDYYLANRAPVSFLSDLRSRLQVSNQAGHKYNVSVLNAMVVYVGKRAIQVIQRKEQRPSISNISHTSHMDIFQNLAVDLDSEGRYLFFNAIVNQLRYPNTHTLYFGCALLYLFSGANAEAIQEQITRVLFERLVSLRPHPWGLMMTFIELIHNASYHFWSHFFVHCSPEVERFFQSLRNHRHNVQGSTTAVATTAAAAAAAPSMQFALRNN